MSRNRRKGMWGDTHYLKFPDEQTFIQACEEANFTFLDEEGEVIIRRYSHEHAMFVAGEITEITAPPEYNGNGEVIKGVSFQVVDGWHVNYKGKLPDSFKDYVIKPKTPRSVFAGDKRGQ